MPLPKGPFHAPDSYKATTPLWPGEDRCKQTSALQIPGQRHSTARLEPPEQALPPTTKIIPQEKTPRSPALQTLEERHFDTEPVRSAGAKAREQSPRTR